MLHDSESQEETDFKSKSETLFSKVSSFSRRWFSPIVTRYKLILTVNVLFFGAIILVLSILTLTRPTPTLLSNQPIDFHYSSGIDLPTKAFTVLIHNLSVTFRYSTLPGILLFPLSLIFPLYNGIVWATVSYGLTDQQFLTVLPTFLLEGEALCLAASAAMVLGISILKPKWLHGEQQIDRVDSFLKVLKEETLSIYSLAIIFFIVAALVESTTEYFLVL